MKVNIDKNISEFLEEKHNQYNSPEFISGDPIQIPHLYSYKKDIEIAAFLTAIISWGQRQSIIKKARELAGKLGENPYAFIMEAEPKHFNKFNSFVYRTFNGIDTVYFLSSLKNIYQNHDGLEAVFKKGYNKNNSVFESLMYFRELFFQYSFPQRTTKHIANVQKNSSAKRLNMFLRWMVRDDHRGVDFGIWSGIHTANLMIPLDVHTGNVARKLGLLNRNQSDWKAVEELTIVLRNLDPSDPVKYDFALFGLGIFEKF